MSRARGGFGILFVFVRSCVLALAGGQDPNTTNESVAAGAKVKARRQARAHPEHAKIAIASTAPIEEGAAASRRRMTQKVCVSHSSPAALWSGGFGVSRGSLQGNFPCKHHVGFIWD